MGKAMSGLESEIVLRLDVSDVLGTTDEELRDSPLLLHIWEGFRQQRFKRNTTLLVMRGPFLVTSISKLATEGLFHEPPDVQ